MLRFKQWLAAALICVCAEGLTTEAQAQEIATSGNERATLKHLMRVIRSRPYYALSWHELKLVAVDEESVVELKDALKRSGRPDADVMEQTMLVDAASGHPEAALAFYDGNIAKYPEDKTRANAACWVRAANGLDLQHALVACNAALAADRQSYTLTLRAKAELQLGLFEAALQDFDEALRDTKFQSHPMLADAAFGRGMARMRLGDPGGREDVAAAMQANSRLAESFADIGITP